MPSASMSMMRACGSNPPLRPSAYFRVLALTIPCRTPTEPRLPIPRGLPSSLPSTLRRSLPFSSMTNRGRRSRNSGSMYVSHRSSGSRMWPSASTMSYARVIGNPSEGNRTAAILTLLRRPAVRLGARTAHEHRAFALAQAVGLAEWLDGLFVVDDGEGASPVGSPQAPVETPRIEHAGERVPDVGEGIWFPG